jgi:hypothetical protein
VQDNQVVVNKLMVNAVTGVFLQTFIKLPLKFGPEAEVAQDIHAVTVVRSQLEDTAAVMLPELLILILTVNTQFVQAAHGLVVNHTLAQRVWDVVHM